MLPHDGHLTRYSDIAWNSRSPIYERKNRTTRPTRESAFFSSVSQLRPSAVCVRGPVVRRCERWPAGAPLSKTAFRARGAGLVWRANAPAPISEIEIEARG